MPSNKTLLEIVKELKKENQTLKKHKEHDYEQWKMADNKIKSLKNEKTFLRKRIKIRDLKIKEVEKECREYVVRILEIQKERDEIKDLSQTELKEALETNKRRFDVQNTTIISQNKTIKLSQSNVHAWMKKFDEALAQNVKQKRISYLCFETIKLLRDCNEE